MWQKALTMLVVPIQVILWESLCIDFPPTEYYVRNGLFVRKHWPNFKPLKHLPLCSTHFEPTCFTQVASLVSPDCTRRCALGKWSKLCYMLGTHFWRDGYIRGHGSPEGGGSYLRGHGSPEGGGGAWLEAMCLFTEVGGHLRGHVSPDRGGGYLRGHVSPDGGGGYLRWYGTLKWTKKFV